MCAPMLGAVAGLAGSVVSGIGAASAANAQAGVADYNAIVHDINAIGARQKARSQADLEEDKRQRELSIQRVAAASSGVRINEGSVARVIDQEGEKNAWLDEMNTIWNGETEAIAEENQARAKRAEAAAIRSSAKTSFLTSIIGGAKGFATQIG